MSSTVLVAVVVVDVGGGGGVGVGVGASVGVGVRVVVGVGVVVLPRSAGSSSKYNAMTIDRMIPPIPHAIKLLATLVDPDKASTDVTNIIPLRLEVDMMPHALPC